MKKTSAEQRSVRAYWILLGVCLVSWLLSLIFWQLYHRLLFSSAWSPAQEWERLALSLLTDAFSALNFAARWLVCLRYRLRRCLPVLILVFLIDCWNGFHVHYFFVPPDAFRLVLRYAVNAVLLPLLSCVLLFLLAKGLMRLFRGREWAAILSVAALRFFRMWFAYLLQTEYLVGFIRTAAVEAAACLLLSAGLHLYLRPRRERTAKAEDAGNAGEGPSPSSFPFLTKESDGALPPFYCPTRKVDLQMYQFIQGGVTAAKGFSASGVHCGIRKNREKKDLALILSDRPAAAAAVYTRNLVKGAPIAVTASHLENGVARAVICNSGIANTCAADGVEKAEAMCRLTAEALGVAEEDVIVASTGVIGPSIDLAPIQAGMPALAAGLSKEGHTAAAEAIMTTDTMPKEFAVSFSLGGVPCAMGGIAKGSGMIAPNMATMLSFITTDAAVSAPLLKKALAEVAADTFNMMSVDGDTSTNDTLAILANGAAGNPPVEEAGADYAAFVQALRALCTALTKALAADGEGATKLLECRVTGGKTDADARTIAKAVINSALLKAAMFGADANWGRVLCAIGYSGAAVDVHGVDVAFSSAAGSIPVCANGAGIPFDEDRAKEILSQKEIVIAVTLHGGEASATAWGCDLTYDYVRINGDYRS